ncbi:MAG: response regulator [Candidatus Acidiferrales bacterium]|jgi:signal transduction histidine kinase/CheY-like chemotaxis protein/HPt (histidine-containing phosphotransfer) domain-containing protein
MSSNSLFESFLAGQGYALFESLGDGDFLAIGNCPDWCREVFEIDTKIGKRNRLAENSPFLENFLVDAEEFWNTKSEGSASSGNWTERGKNGRDIPLEAFALSLDGKKILILRNLSATFAEQQQWFQTARDSLLVHEQLLSEIQKKEILLHCIVHDLSQPLSAMTGCFNLLSLEHLPAGLRKLVETGQSESQRQELMIRGILSAFSGDLLAQESTSDKGAAAPDLVTCAQKAIEEFSSAFADKNIRLRFEPPQTASSDWRVVGDAPRLDRIFGNLLENTLRYSPPKSTVKIGVEDQSAYVLAFVDDEGPGLPADLPINQLFALFSKGKSHSGKAGLGLYFCKITVERWGGTIGAENRSQGGSRFWFRLPRAKASPRDQSTPSADADRSAAAATSPKSAGIDASARTATPEKPLKRLRILVTDDTEINRQLVLELLKKRGHSVSGAADGLEALAALERAQFDVVLMDEEMPRMNGLEATRAIRKTEAASGRHVRIVGLTGNASYEDERRCLDAGMDAFIAKPVRMDKLYEAVESVIDAGKQINDAKPAHESSVSLEAALPGTGNETAAAHLHRATGGNEKLQRSLIKAFLQDAPKTILLIERAIAKKDAQKLAASAHALKGSIAIFGAAKAVAIAAELQAMGRSGHLAGADSQFRALEAEFARLKPELLAIHPALKPKPGAKPKNKPKSEPKSRRKR